jgi:hypothetical protein
MGVDCDVYRSSGHVRTMSWGCHARGPIFLLPIRRRPTSCKSVGPRRVARRERSGDVKADDLQQQQCGASACRKQGRLRGRHALGHSQATVPSVTSLGADVNAPLSSMGPCIKFVTVEMTSSSTTTRAEAVRGRNCTEPMPHTTANCQRARTINDPDDGRSPAPRQCNGCRSPVAATDSFLRTFSMLTRKAESDRSKDLYRSAVKKHPKFTTGNGSCFPLSSLLGA